MGRRERGLYRGEGRGVNIERELEIFSGKFGRFSRKVVRGMDNEGQWFLKRR